MRSSSACGGVFTWNEITASVGGFSPMNVWWPQNSSLRLSIAFHCSAVGTEKSRTLAACAAAYSWMGSRWSSTQIALPCDATSIALSRG